MNTYKVTMTLDKNQLVSFIDIGGDFVARASIKPITTEHETPPVIEKKPRHGRRGPRGSKVSSTILETLAAGPMPVKGLKEALEKAGMAPGSLSTGLAVLQRAGAIKRASEGVYELAQAAQ